MSDHDTVGEVKKNFLNQDFLKETKVQDLLNKVKEGLLANLPQLRDCETLRPPKRYTANYVEFDEPIIFLDPLVTGGNADHWIDAINELEAYKRNNIWSLVPFPTDRKIINSKWVFKIKRDESGRIFKYKACLCAKSCSQQEGVDYSEIFFPVVKYNSIRILLLYIMI